MTTTETIALPFTCPEPMPATLPFALPVDLTGPLPARPQVVASSGEDQIRARVLEAVRAYAPTATAAWLYLRDVWTYDVYLEGITADVDGRVEEGLVEWVRVYHSEYDAQLRRLPVRVVSIEK